jgi:hypothetical protein
MGIMIATSIATTIVQQKQAASAAKRQRRQIEAQAEFQMEQALTAAREQREATALEMEQVAIEGMKMKGEAKAKGLTGLSADAVLRDVGAMAARAKDVSGRNFEIGNRRAANELRGVGLNRAAKLSEVRGADWVGAGLSIASSVAQGAGAAMSGGCLSVGSGMFGANNMSGTTGGTNPLASGSMNFGAIA